MKIYDATTSRQLPSLPRCGVIYEFAHKDYSTSPPSLGHCLYPTGDRSIMPTADRIAYAAEPLLADASDPCHLIVLDDESRQTENLWSNTRHLTEQQLEANRDHYARLLDNARVGIPGMRLGLYGVATPGYAHSEGFKDAGVEAFASRLGYDRLPDGSFGSVGVIEGADFVCPVGYCRSSDEDFGEWRRRMVKTVAFCRRWHRQIVLFISPSFSPKHAIPCPWFADCLAWINDQ